MYDAFRDEIELQYGFTLVSWYIVLVVKVCRMPDNRLVESPRETTQPDRDCPQ